MHVRFLSLLVLWSLLPWGGLGAQSGRYRPALLPVHVPGIVLNEPDHDDRRFRLGFGVGLHVMDASVRPGLESDYYAGAGSLSPGFTVSGVANLRLTRHLDLRCLPGVLLGARNIVFVGGERLETEVKAQYIEAPLLLKLKSERVSNIRPFLIAGVAPRYNLNASSGSRDVIEVKTQPLEFFYEGGAAVDFYLPYFKLGVEFKGSWGMGNALERIASDSHPEYRTAIGKLRHSVYMFTLYFE
jgi:hypothetical protein